MCWKCDHPDADEQDYIDELRSTMLEHGWAVQYVESDRRPFAYTVGLHEWGLPELLVTGMPPQQAVRLLNSVAADALSGELLTPGRRIAPPAGPLIEIVRVDHPDAHLKFAVAIGGPDVHALQLVWADGLGRWPWAARFGDGRGRQPVFGVRAQKA